jgi:hypothetical protein
MQSVYDNKTVQYRLKYGLEMKHRDISISKATAEGHAELKTMKP